jgi:methyl-accepting chemotaxis protein
MKNITIKQKLYYLNIGILITLLILVGFIIQTTLTVENNFVIVSSSISSVEELKLQKSIESINQAIENTKISLPILLITNLILSILLFINIKSVVQNIRKTEEGLLNFFSFLNRKSNHITNINIDTNDELGVMAKAINENMLNTKNNLDSDIELIDNTVKIADAVKRGHLKSRIKKSSQNPELNRLKDVVNDMLNSVYQDITSIIDILNQYSEYNYDNNVDTSNMSAQIKSLAVGVNTLGDSITHMLVENKKNGLILDEYSDTLKNSVDNISSSMAEQAASLEETAANVEEITSIIQQTTNKAESMSKLASKTQNSANSGLELANETTNAMEEINIQTTAIAEAITVIDQISFQTNILSLNAAVEAATAGEAGKGFAVVAGEVRNLASRSADAASNIKELVLSAKEKADNGKLIALDMIKGYDNLDNNIKQTTTLISDVEKGAKEQLDEIEQINKAISTLDHKTQTNANMILNTNQVAINTHKIAKDVLAGVNKKSFNGKDTVKINKDEQIIKNVDIDNTKANSILDNQPSVSTKAPIPQINEDSEWDSF